MYIHTTSPKQEHKPKECPRDLKKSHIVKTTQKYDVSREIRDPSSNPGGKQSSAVRASRTESGREGNSWNRATGEER